MTTKVTKMTFVDTARCAECQGQAHHRVDRFAAAAQRSERGAIQQELRSLLEETVWQIHSARVE